MCAVYVDDCISVDKTTKLIKRAIQQLLDILEITYEGEIDEYLVVKIEKLELIKFSGLMKQESLVSKSLENSTSKSDKKLN